MNNRFFLASILIMGIGMSFLQAEQAQEISVRFTCLAWDRFDVEGVKYQSAEEALSLRISSSRRSQIYTYRGTDPIIFFTERTLADGAVERVPLATASIPSGMTDVLLLFLERHDPQPGEPLFNVAVINDGTNAFPWGSYCIYNLSAYEVGGIIGSERFRIPGNGSKVVTPDGDGQITVEIHFSQMIDEEWVPKVNTRWLYRSDARQIVFVTDDKTTRNPRLKIKSIPQYRPN